jgi:polysaccharide export outer membrane protein
MNTDMKKLILVLFYPNSDPFDLNLRLANPLGKNLMRYLICFCLLAATTMAQPPAAPASAPTPAPDYVLGAGDQLSLAVENLTDEFANRTFRIDLGGDINLPLAGRIHAASLTIGAFESQIQQRLARYVKDPQVVVTITEFNSQPVSVLGAVNNGGIKQIVGHKTLFEVLSLAGGLRSDAGSSIKITRNIDHGPIPLPDAKTDPTGQFSVASVDVKAILNATDPAQNIVIIPGDIISVSKGDVIYAVGSVTRPGGFPLNQDVSLSALQVLSLAGGLTQTAALEKAQILRSMPGTSEHTGIAVNLKRIMAGKSPDIPLQPNDVLFVPNSAARTFTYKAIDILSLAAVYGRM